MAQHKRSNDSCILVHQDAPHQEPSENSHLTLSQLLHFDPEHLQRAQQNVQNLGQENQTDEVEALFNELEEEEDDVPEPLCYTEPLNTNVLQCAALENDMIVLHLSEGILVFYDINTGYEYCHIYIDTKSEIGDCTSSKDGSVICVSVDCGTLVFETKEIMLDKSQVSTTISKGNPDGFSDELILPSKENGVSKGIVTDEMCRRLVLSHTWSCDLDTYFAEHVALSLDKKFVFVFGFGHCPSSFFIFHLSDSLITNDEKEVFENKLMAQSLKRADLIWSKYLFDAEYSKGFFSTVHNYLILFRYSVRQNNTSDRFQVYRAYEEQKHIGTVQYLPDCNIRTQLMQHQVDGENMRCNGDQNELLAIQLQANIIVYEISKENIQLLHRIKLQTKYSEISCLSPDGIFLAAHDETSNVITMYRLFNGTKEHCLFNETKSDCRYIKEPLCISKDNELLVVSCEKHGATRALPLHGKWTTLYQRDLRHSLFRKNSHYEDFAFNQCIVHTWAGTKFITEPEKEEQSEQEQSEQEQLEQEQETSSDHASEIFSENESQEL